jgi:hypothetical protein
MSLHVSEQASVSSPHNKKFPNETKQQRDKRLRAARAKWKRQAPKRKRDQRELRDRLAQDDDAVLTFREWCTLNGFGERTGRRILAAPGGPIVTKLTAKCIGISRRNNRAWLKARSPGQE